LESVTLILAVQGHNQTCVLTLWS